MALAHSYGWTAYRWGSETIHILVGRLTAVLPGEGREVGRWRLTLGQRAVDLWPGRFSGWDLGFPAPEGQRG